MMLTAHIDTPVHSASGPAVPWSACVAIIVISALVAIFCTLRHHFTKSISDSMDEQERLMDEQERLMDALRPREDVG